MTEQAPNNTETTHLRKEQYDNNHTSVRKNSMSKHGACDNINVSLASNKIDDSFEHDGVNRYDVGGSYHLTSFLEWDI
jgi:hypothetical protein